MCPLSPYAAGFYMEVLIPGVNTLYMGFCLYISGVERVKFMLYISDMMPEHVEEEWESFCPNKLSN